MNPEKLKELLKENPDAVDYEMVDGRIILTSGTSRLQTFMLEHCGEESELFGNVITLSKKNN
jgi:hypothetical protein